MHPPQARLLVAAVGMSFLLALSGADMPRSRRADQEALKAFAPWVGSWRGVGQPQRGSRKGSWQESAAWSWRFQGDAASLELTVENGKYLRSARLNPGAGPREIVLDVVSIDGTAGSLTGTAVDKGPMVFKARQDTDRIARITLTPLHDTRFLMLLEGRGEGGEGLARLGEVGFTRQGVAFAAGESGPVCIVTGGRGTTQVRYNGQSFYVCCSGCKDLFEADPAGVLAEAKAKQDGKQ